MNEFLPKAYVKNRNVERMIFIEHRKCSGLTELEAKARYTQLARALKTYGVTFFLVKVSLLKCHTSFTNATRDFKHSIQ